MIPEKIAVFGASSVYGRVDPEGGGWVGRLRKWHEGRKPKWNGVYNLGIPGNTTESMLKRIEVESTARKPDLIIFSLGINDSKRLGGRTAPLLISKEQYKNNILKLINIAKGIADVMVVGVYPIDDSKTTPVSWDDKFYLQRDAYEYEGITRNVVSSGKIPYLDVWSKWVGNDYKTFLYKDGLHPNSEGHQEIFLLVKGFLELLYNKAG